MIPSLLSIPVSADFVPASYRPPSVIVSRAQIVAKPFPYIEVGTGGLPVEMFVRQGFGYHPYVVIKQARPVENTPYAKLMNEVKSAFGRTMSRLPEVFGVSRQTLYNWLEGETPREAHQERLKQLAEAARVFADLGITPTSAILDRTVAQSKSFLQLLAEGADGEETAKKLVHIIQRGSDSRTKLNKLLAGRKGNLTASDIGTPMLDEGA